MRAYLAKARPAAVLMLVVAVSTIFRLPALADSASGEFLLRAYISTENVSRYCTMTLKCDEASYEAIYSAAENALVVRAAPGTYQAEVTYRGESKLPILPAKGIVTIVSGKTARHTVTLEQMSFSDLAALLTERSSEDIDSTDDDSIPVPIRLHVTAAGKIYSDAFPQVYQNGKYVTSLSPQGDGCYIGSVEPGVYDISIGAEIMGMPSAPRLEGLEVRARQPCEVTLALDKVHVLTATPVVNGELYTGAYVSVYRDDEFIGCLVDTGDSDRFSSLIYEGVYTLRVELEDTTRYTPVDMQDIAVQSNTSVSLVLRPRLPLTVAVTSSGEPYSTASVTAIGSNEKYKLNLTGEAGIFLAEVPEGTYALEVTPHDKCLETKRLDEFAVSGPSAEVSVEVGSFGRIEVEILGEDDTPYGRADVRLVRGDAHVASLIWNHDKGLYSTDAKTGCYDIVITPRSYYQPKRISDVNISPHDTTRQTVLLSGIGSPDPPTLKVHSESDLRDLAAAYKERYLSELDFRGRTGVECELRDLEVDEPTKTTNALELSSAAALMEGVGYRYPAIVLAAAAAEILPDVPVVVCNFGAMLYALDQIDDSISVLFYAHSLAPDSDIILINLANGFYARGDYDRAEALFLEALSLDQSSSLAHRGLGTIYLERGDAQRALEHFFKAAQGMYTPAIRQGYSEAKSAGGKTAPSFAEAVVEAQQSSTASSEGGSLGSDRSSSSSSAGSGPDAESQLVIPPLPDWPTREGFLASARSFVSFGEAVQEAVLGSAMRYLSGSSGSAPDYGTDSRRALKTLKHVWQLGCFQDYYLDRIMERYDEYQREVEAIDREWAGEVERLAKTTAEMVAVALDVPIPSPINESMLSRNPTIRPVEQLEYWKKVFAETTEYLLEVSEGFKEADDILRKSDEQAQAAGDRGFLRWKAAIHDCYSDVSMLLEEYWLYTDDIVTSTFDQELTDQLNEMRRTFIYSGIYPICTDIAGRLIAFEFATRIPTLSEHGLEQVDPPRSEPAGEIDVPNREAKECTQGTRGISMIAASVEWDCDSVTFDFTEGLSASAKIDFRKMEVTLFAGAGLSAKAGVGAASAGLSGKVGGYITLDKDFNVVDVGMKSSIGVGGSIAGAGGSSGVDFAIGLATGPKGGASSQVGFSTDLGTPGD